MIHVEHYNGCCQPTEDGCSSGHLVLSHLGRTRHRHDLSCLCSNFQTILVTPELVMFPFMFILIA